MSNSVFFEVHDPDHGDGVWTHRIHEALLEFASYNKDGAHPELEPFKAENGLWVRWASYAAALEQC